MMLFIFLNLWYLSFIAQGVSDNDMHIVPVKAGDSATLHTGIKKTQEDRIRWYFDDTRIAQINGDPSKTCTDVQCNEGTERFRDRLILDHQTGSLTITNIRTEDAGDYQLKILSSSSLNEKIFSVYVRDLPASDEMKRKSVNVGEPVTLDPAATKNPNDVMRWYFNDNLFTEVTVQPNETCRETQCDERFRNRMKLDHQTGSLTITNTRITDSGLYEVEIISSRNRRSRSVYDVKSFDVTVINAGVSSGLIAGIVVSVLLLLVSTTAVVIYYKHRLCDPRRLNAYEGVTVVM